MDMNDSMTTAGPVLTTPSGAHSPLGRSPRIGFATGLTLAYLIVAGYQIFHHVLWLDEWEAWLLARDSHSLPELFRHLHYETHPPLWHLCLYAITRFTTDVRAMQAFHLALAAAGVYIVAAWSPLTRTQAVLYAFGYFVLFEYCALSRGYVLGLLLTLIAAMMLRHGARRLGFYLVVALLAQAEPYGIVLGASLVAAALTQVIWEWRRGNKPTPAERKIIALGLAIVMVSGALAFYQTFPPADCSYVARDKTVDVARTLRSVLRTFLNLPAFGSWHFWNRSVFDDCYHLTRIVQCSLSLLIFAVLAIVFLSRPVGLVMLTLGMLGTLAALFVSMDDAYRHSGHLFVALAAAYWIAEETRGLAWASAARVDAMRRRVFTGMLVLQIFPAGWAFYCERRAPFSGSRQAAAFVRDHFPADTPVVVFYDLSGPAFSGYLGRPVYYTSRQEYGTFLIWDGKRMARRNPLPEVRRIQKQTGRDVVVLTPPDIPEVLLPSGPDVPKLIPQTNISQTIDACDTYGIYLAPYGEVNFPIDSASQNAVGGN